MKPNKPITTFHTKQLPGVASINEDSNIATGFLAAYGNVDSDREIMVKGCCAKSITERGPQSSTPRKIAFLAYHKQDLPIGRFTKLEELEKGLYYEAELDTVPYVTETIKPQLKSGTLNNHSVGYDYIWDKTEYDETRDAYILKEVELYEGSVLCLGANEFTPFGGFKSFVESMDDYNDMVIRAKMLIKKIPSYENQMELLKMFASVQSLYEYAADEIEKLTAKHMKPKKIDYKRMADNFKL